jgi:nitroreductase
MDFETVVKRRRMCRKYLGREVPQEKVDRILDLASRYPSAGHTEPQEFIVVRDQRVREDLARATLDQMFVAQAPLVIVVVSDVRRSARRYGERGVHFFSITAGGRTDRTIFPRLPRADHLLDLLGQWLVLLLRACVLALLPAPTVLVLQTQPAGFLLDAPVSVRVAHQLVASFLLATLPVPVSRYVP